jgi:hypothetical protein
MLLALTTSGRGATQFVEQVTLAIYGYQQRPNANFWGW